jgi:opacity protein-like surface antigen
MSKRGSWVVLTVMAAVIVSLLMAADARAQETSAPAGESARPRPISAALFLGFGTALGEDANPYGFGFGVRGGYNLGPIYLGGRFVYHLGSSEEVQSAGLALVEVSFSLWEFGAEAGYDFQVMDRFIVRPSVILGVSSFITSSDAPLFGDEISSSGSDAKFLFSLGGSALYDITPMWFVGGELRLPISLGGDSVVGLVFYATGGARF